uniref:Ubiquitin-like protease family profile domain-containing protein n=2 Tax=Fagus sylvatica TaxID=28930 RepID=A0A2N9JBG0_FAGSY
MVRTLLPNNWVVSDVIDYVASQLAMQEKARSGGEITIWYLPTTFAIYIPINDSNTHWYLVVVDVREKEIQYFDTMSSSLHFADRKKQIAAMVKALNDFMLHPKVTPTATFEDLDMTSWPLVTPPAVPIQPDGSSCGIYVIQFMRLPILSPHYQSVTATDADRLNIVLELVLHDSNQLKTDLIAAASFRTSNLKT